MASTCDLSLLYDLRLRAMRFRCDYILVQRAYIVDGVHTYILVACLLRVVSTQWQHHRLSLLLNVAVSEGCLFRRRCLFIILCEVLIENKCLLTCEDCGVGCWILSEERLSTFLLVVDSVRKVTNQGKLHGGIYNFRVG